MEEFPSGQRGQTVNLLRLASVVRIHPPPPRQSKRHIACSDFLSKSERAHSAALPSQTEPAPLGSGLVPPPAASSLVTSLRLPFFFCPVDPNRLLAVFASCVSGKRKFTFHRKCGTLMKIFPLQRGRTCPLLVPHQRCFPVRLRPSSRRTLCIPPSLLYVPRGK